MNSILNKVNLGATKDWKFLRYELISIFAADDSRLLEEYENGEIEQVFDKMAEEYLDGYTVSGFCLDANDSVDDAVTLITVLAGASLHSIHPFGWDLRIGYDDEGNPLTVLRPKNTSYGVPDIFMIDFSNAAENFNEEFKRTLDEYMTLFGYGHMDTVYGERLVYISKLSYAYKTKNTADIIDSANNRFYTLKFDPYNFDLLMNTRTTIMSVIASVLLMEIAIAHRCGKETFKIKSSGGTNFDLIRTDMCDIANAITSNAMYTPGVQKDIVLCNRASEPEYTEFEITSVIGC